MKTLMGLYLRLILLPILLLTAVLLLIRIQPRDDHELRQLLLPDGCPAPCFLGIQPGVTTGQEALKRLQASAWISEIDNGVGDKQQGFIFWDWSNQRPRSISANAKGKIWVTEQRVETITIYGDFRLGETTLLLGFPEGE